MPHNGYIMGDTIEFTPEYPQKLHVIPQLTMTVNSLATELVLCVANKRFRENFGFITPEHDYA